MSITEQEYQQRRRQAQRKQNIRMAIFVYIPLAAVLTVAAIGVYQMWIH